MYNHFRSQTHSTNRIGVHTLSDNDSTPRHSPCGKGLHAKMCSKTIFAVAEATSAPEPALVAEPLKVLSRTLEKSSHRAVMYTAKRAR